MMTSFHFVVIKQDLTMLIIFPRMLEDPSYDKIVRWGEGGESFVVLEVRDTSRNVPLGVLTEATE